MHSYVILTSLLRKLSNVYKAFESYVSRLALISRLALECVKSVVNNVYSVVMHCKMKLKVLFSIFPVVLTSILILLNLITISFTDAIRSKRWDFREVFILF